MLYEPVADLAAEPLTVEADGANAEASMSPVRFEIIRSRAAFDALEDDWNELFERAGVGAQLFQTFNWNWHWANHFLSDGAASAIELVLVTGRRDGRLVTVWPLVKEKAHGVSQVYWMGEPVSQYGDVLIDALPDARDVLRQGWAFLSANVVADLVRLRRVRADANLAPLLNEIGASVCDRQTAPFLDLARAKTFAEYEDGFTARSRRNRRRLARRLSEVGKVTFERHVGGAAARALALKAIDLKIEWLRDRGLVSQALSDARTARFFADAADGRDKSTTCIVSALLLDGEAAALEVSFACKGRLALHILVFALKFEKYGVGALRLEQSLRDGFDDSLQVFDMMAPGDNYKLDWADGSVEVIDWAKPQSLAGHAYARVYLGFVRAHAKAVLKAMPPSLRRALTGSYAAAAA